MAFSVTFLEGILTFISPCLLPMLPIYLSFLAGNISDGSNTNEKKRPIVINAVAFVLGFSIVFILLGAASATFGVLIWRYKRVINIVGGLFMIVLGLHYAGFFNIPLLNKTKSLDIPVKVTGFLSAVLFGAVFSVGWMPCVGPWLGSALMQAASVSTFSTGVGLLIAYCAGLGVPFVLSAVFIRQLQRTFTFIKKHYRVINIICGVFLICLGGFMLTGYYNMFISFFRVR